MYIRLSLFIGLAALLIALGGTSGQPAVHAQRTTSWSLNGNAGTAPGDNFLGTLDSSPLEFRVANARALRLEPTGGSPNVLAGASGNSAGVEVLGATVSGGGELGASNTIYDDYGSVGGGAGNSAGDWDTEADKQPYATVGGGRSNVASGAYATIGGGMLNSATGERATIGGGYSNASGPGATVAGGNLNTADATAATVGGGISNSASAEHATVAGGGANAAEASAASVGGGFGNRATGAQATVSGGYNNLASGTDATVGGGLGSTASAAYATVAGGAGNRAGGSAATVGGGRSNNATGMYAMVPGGYGNAVTGSYSMAAGYRAQASHSGSFVWADARPFEFASTAFNQFSVRATGGARMVTSVDAVTGEPRAGVHLAGGAGAWSSLSDRNAKARFADVDHRLILDRLAAIPVQTWSYLSQDPSIRHIGPTAQDFAAAFGVGEDATHISTIDADGVALAAIQGLYGIVQEKEQQISTLERENRAMQQQIATLERDNRDLAARLQVVEEALMSDGASSSATRGSGNLLVVGAIAAAAMSICLAGGVLVVAVLRRPRDRSVSVSPPPA